MEQTGPTHRKITAALKATFKKTDGQICLKCGKSDVFGYLRATMMKPLNLSLQIPVKKRTWAIIENNDDKCNVKCFKARYALQLLTSE